MSVYKDEKTGKWYALAWYHDWKGEGRQKCKRGFETKKRRRIGSGAMYSRIHPASI